MGTMRLEDIKCTLCWYDDDETWEMRDEYWLEPFETDFPDRDHQYRSYVNASYESDDGAYSGMCDIYWDEDGSVTEINFEIYAEHPSHVWLRDLHETYTYLPHTNNKDIWSYMDSVYYAWYESLKRY